MHNKLNTIYAACRRIKAEASNQSYQLLVLYQEQMEALGIDNMLP
jgi:hypothetical protein